MIGREKAQKAQKKKRGWQNLDQMLKS